MKLLDALKTMMGSKATIAHARIACFAFDGEDVAYITQIDEPELIVMMEDWCRKMRKAQRKTKEVVH